jgi:hypothetical protein
MTLAGPRRGPVGMGTMPLAVAAPVARRRGAFGVMVAGGVTAL